MTLPVLVLPMPRALVPPVSLTDPVAEVRAACEDAVDKLLAADPALVAVVAPPVGEANARRGVTDPLGLRVARHLLSGRVPVEELVAGPDATARLAVLDPDAVVVVADGSASRGEKAPGHLHPGAVAFDDALDAALRAGDAEALTRLDPDLAREVWCEGVPAWAVLGELARGRVASAEVTWAGDPRGVAWWVARWELGSPAPRT